MFWDPKTEQWWEGFQLTRKCQLWCFTLFIRLVFYRGVSDCWINTWQVRNDCSPPFWAGFGGKSADLKCVGDLSGCPRVKWWKMGVRVTNNLMCSRRPERKITSSISSSSSSFPISIVRGIGLHVCVWDKGVCPLFVLCGEVKIMIRTNTFAHIHCLNLLLRSN